MKKVNVEKLRKMVKDTCPAMEEQYVEDHVSAIISDLEKGELDLFNQIMYGDAIDECIEG